MIAITTAATNPDVAASGATQPHVQSKPASASLINGLTRSSQRTTCLQDRCRRTIGSRPTEATERLRFPRIGRRAVERHSALVEHDDALGDAYHEAEVVRHEKHPATHRAAATEERQPMRQVGAIATDQR